MTFGYNISCCATGVSFVEKNMKKAKLLKRPEIYLENIGDFVNFVKCENLGEDR